VVHCGEPSSERERLGVEQGFCVDDPQDVPDFVRGEAREILRQVRGGKARWLVFRGGFDDLNDVSVALGLF